MLSSHVLFFLLIGISLVESKTRMNAVIGGKVVYNNDCVALEKNEEGVEVDSVSCVVYCGRSKTCEVAIWKRPGCNICEYGDVKTIIRTQKEDYLIAYKADPEHPEMCSDVYDLPVRSTLISTALHTETTPAISSPTVIGSIERSTLKPTKSLEDTTTTKLRTTAPAPKCPTNYQMFTRNSISYCLGIESSLLISITKDEGMKMCNKVGARISGPDSIQEKSYVINRIGQLFGSLVYTGIGVWLDGTLNDTCTKLPLSLDKVCKSLQAFTFSDSTLQSRNGYTFFTGQPDGTSNGQNCLQMMITGNTQNGLIDDVGCGVYYGYGVYSKAVVCGLLPV